MAVWQSKGIISPSGAEWRSFTGGLISTASPVRIRFLTVGNFNKIASWLWLRRVWNGSEKFVSQAVKVYPKPELVLVFFPLLSGELEFCEYEAMLGMSYYRQWTSEPTWSAELEEFL